MRALRGQPSGVYRAGVNEQRAPPGADFLAEAHPVRLRRLVTLFCVLVLPFLAVLDAFFVSDDLQMWLFGATMPPQEIAWVPSSRWTWHRPLPALSWIVNYRVGGDWVQAWHVPNVALHAVSTVMAWRLSRLLSGSSTIALLTAVLFAWSPAAPGTVNWISARPDLLVTMWSLAALVVAYSPRWRQRPMLQAVGVAACVVLAASSKESAFGLLPVAMVLALLPRFLPHVPSQWQLQPRLAIVIVLILGAYLVVRLGLYGTTLGGYGTPLSVRRFFSAPMIAAASLFAPLRLLAWGTSTWPGLGALGLGVAVTALGLSRVPAWTLAALASVLPAAHIISASTPAWEYDRFYYLASFWAAGGLATGLVNLGMRRPRLAMAATVLVVLADAAYLAVRVHGARAAARVVENADRTLRASRGTIPPGSVVWCGALPDNLDESYVYRNGCEEHLQILWPGREVRGLRTGSVPSGSPVFDLSADGRQLVRRQPTGP